MNVNRRGFLKQILALGAAPAVIGSGILMPIRPMWDGLYPFQREVLRVLVAGPRAYTIGLGLNLELGMGKSMTTYVALQEYAKRRNRDLQVIYLDPFEVVIPEQAQSRIFRKTFYEHLE